jgi:hypothetical protein
MVEAVENLTRIAGRITARGPHPQLSDWDLVTLAVDEAQPVEGKADLLSTHLGSHVDVAVRRDLLRDARPGAELSCRAKFTPGGAMCEPHPKRGAFSVSTSTDAT